MKKIHILGICGTFMGGIALLARESGVTVEGSDHNVYPPMSTMLESQGVEIKQGLLAKHISNDCDDLVIGNIMSRGNEVVEHILNQNTPYTSGPKWLYEHILKDRWVLAVSGTHGKTTTASMLAWILEYAGLKPGFLIGGVPENFGISARLGDSAFFVIEADEYDTAFFDKRSKFIHYHPRTLILNNLEYDHADIFPDLAAIQTQFHHLLRMVPSEGLVINNTDVTAIDEVLEQGCWTPTEGFSTQTTDKGWSFNLVKTDGCCFDVLLDGQKQGQVNWSHIGIHNVMNGLAAIAAARHVGVSVQYAIAALAEFKGVKRRMQLRGEVGKIRVYDDFAHHPTAITTTLQGLREKVVDEPILAILEPRSNTMKMGVHRKKIAPALALANHILLYQSSDAEWDMLDVIDELDGRGELMTSTEAIIRYILKKIDGNKDKPLHILVMSNGGFDNIHQRILDALD